MKNISFKKGFTLVEMVISLALFTIVAVVAIGALLRVTDANKKSQSLKTSINNLNFALESMSREIRVGSHYAGATDVGNIFLDDYNYLDPQDISVLNGTWVIAFNSSKVKTFGGGYTAPSGTPCNLVYAYKYDYASTEKTLYKAEQSECGEDLANLVFYPLISPDVKLTESIMKIVPGVSGNDRVFFFFKGHTGETDRSESEFSVQTTVSQRIAN